MKRMWLGFALGTAWTLGIGVSSAAAEESKGCRTRVTRENVVVCALEASLERRAQTEAVAAAKGKEEAAKPWLPKAPVLEVSGARRSAAGMEPVLNVYASLTQEVEIGGQRGPRIAAARAFRQAEELRLSVVEQRVVFEAWEAYFRALWALEMLNQARRGEASARVLGTRVAAQAAQGLSAGLDAHLAGADAVAAAQALLRAEREDVKARAALSLLWGRDAGAPPLSVEGELLPLAQAEAELLRWKREKKPGKSDSVMAKALLLERDAQTARASELRRSRVPNLSISLYAQRDGFRETVFGVGLSLPIPLPEPVTSLHTGEVEEAEALARKAQVEAEALEKRGRAGLAEALLDYEGRKAEAAAFGGERVAQTRRALLDVEQELGAGRISVREAAALHKSLLDVLALEIQARLALCLASVEVLRRAAGVGGES